MPPGILLEITGCELVKRSETMLGAFLKPHDVTAFVVLDWEPKHGDVGALQCILYPVLRSPIHTQRIACNLQRLALQHPHVRSSSRSPEYHPLVIHTPPSFAIGNQRTMRELR